MDDIVQATSLRGFVVEQAHSDDGSVTEVEWIQVEVPGKQKLLNIPLVRIPDHLTNYSEEYFELQVRSQETLGRAMREATLVLWNTPKRYFISAYELRILAQLNEQWWKYEHPFLRIFSE